MELFDILHKNASLFPNRIVFEDEPYGTYTFSRIDELSSRICTYLTHRNIGIEDIVVIRMQKSARILIAMLGIWKAGAAFVGIGEKAPEKIEKNILNDAESGFIFNDSNYEDAILCVASADYINANEHNLACIIYSSGTTGRFKGSMHEYGAIETTMKKFPAAGLEPLYKTYAKETRNLMYVTLFSIDTIIELLYAIYFGNYYYVVPHHAIEKFSDCVRILQDKRIESMCVSSEIRRQLEKIEQPYLKELDLCYDVNTDVIDGNYIYSNSYGLTESFGMVISGYIEKGEYDIIPSGKACPLTQIKICDKRGNELQQGQIGEIYIYNEFFRGYFKNPELTEEILHNGWIHTGDVAYMDSDGNYVILGRTIDTAETDNGYIIGTHISIQIKRNFPDIIKNHVQLLIKKDKIIICVFYCGELEHSVEEFKSALKEKLPEYMLPTHCVRLDDFRYLNSGKIDRPYFDELVRKII